MGLSTSCAIFEAFSRSLHWILVQKFPVTTVSHLLDDFLFVGGPNDSTCKDVMAYFHCICADTDTPIKHSKTVGPTTTILAHGLEVDSQKMELRLPVNKVEKCKLAIN